MLGNSFLCHCFTIVLSMTNGAYSSYSQLKIDEILKQKKKHFSNCYAPMRKNICLRMQRIFPSTVVICKCMIWSWDPPYNFINEGESNKSRQVCQTPLHHCSRTSLNNHPKIKWSLTRIHRQEVSSRIEVFQTHLHFGREFIACNF